MPNGKQPSRRAVLGAAGLAATTSLLPFFRTGPVMAEPGPAGVTPTMATEPVKSASTYYTPARVAAARRNIASFAWARQLRDGVLGYANRIAGQTDQWLWGIVPSQKLPRSINVNYVLGSPVTGKDVYQLGFYPFRIDQWNQPWKITDPLAQQRGLPYVFPTNDFGAFYATALDENGEFDPARGDRSLLVNELYPEKGPTWGVDDGLGWVDDDGNRWTFIAYYCHYGLWWTGVSSIGATAQIWGGLTTLRDAYVYTGDPKYAHAGVILLDRIADIYPEMDVGAYSTDYRNNDPNTKKGKVLGSIWETNFSTGLITAYDAFFPAIADTDLANVLPFLGTKGKDSLAAIRLNLENNILRQILPAVKGAQIYGNFGTHQASLSLAGVVLDEPTEAKEWFDFVFAAGGILPEPEWHVTGGGVYTTLVDKIDRDGWGAEASPFYSNIWFDNLKVVADALDGYEGYPGLDLYTHPKFRNMFTAGPRTVGVNKFLPSIGDSGACGQPGIGLVKANYVKGFEEYDDALPAQLAYLLNGNRSAGLNTGIFSEDPAGTEAAIQKVVDTQGPLDLPSDNLTGFGLAWLRDGELPNKREAWISYGRSEAAHGATDQLNLGLYGFGLDLLPDHGYPEATDYTNFSQEWTKNTVSHNSVVVNRHPQKTNWVGVPHGFGSGERVRLADIAAPKAYPDVETYRRVTALVNVDATNSYLVDVFRVVGGTDHVFSFHAAEGAVSTDGLTLVEQPTGTYAGADVEMPGRRETPTDWDSPGFHWLDQVSRDTAPTAPFSFDWDLVDTWNANPDPDPDLHVRLTVVGDVDDVAVANGYPPQNNPRNPRHLRYALLHRAGADLASQFVSVVEPYAGQRFVRSIASVPVVGPDVTAHEAAAVRVELVDGRVDYVISCLRPDVTLRVDGRVSFRGAFGMVSLRDGELEYAYAHDATLLAPAPAGFRPPATVAGQLVDFTRELSAENHLVVRTRGPVPAPEQLVGQYVYVTNDNERNAAYRITGASRDASGQLFLDIGTASTVRRYVDDNDFGKGFQYDVAVGAHLRIPLSKEWSR